MMEMAGMAGMMIIMRAPLLCRWWWRRQGWRRQDNDRQQRWMDQRSLSEGDIDYGYAGHWGMRVWWIRKAKTMITMIFWSTQSYQFHKHVTDSKKKRCNRDEKEAQARSTTIPHPPTGTKKLQRKTENVDLNTTFPIRANEIHCLWGIDSKLCLLDNCTTTVSCDGPSAEPGQVVYSCTENSSLEAELIFSLS